MYQLFIDKFKIPQEAVPYITLFFTKEEIDFVEQMDKEVFTKEDVAKLKENPEEFIKKAYGRGVISIDNPENDTFKINDFYGRLDIFAVSETDKYKTIPKEDRNKIDDWYFEQFYTSLNPDPNVRPTGDKILTLAETLDFIDSQNRPVYLNYCDCRSLKGDCGMPTKTCITYKDGINTFAHRGLSEEIDKEKAKEIVKEADKKGLMHTVNPNGICNCCNDCCYLFRGQERRDSRGFWPETEHIVEIDKDKCVGCGKCVGRCFFKVFSKDGREVSLDKSKCVGCGICATGCPVGALTMKGR